MGLFEREDDFISARENFASHRDSFAQCQKNLPLREKPDSDSKNIYKLREGQILKVLDREENEVTIGNLTGYWYKLLTEDGVTGYTFDYYLTVYDLNKDGTQTVLNRREEEDIVLDNIIDAFWRPDYYRSMIRDGMIDMNSFKEEYRFYINSSSKSIHIQTAERELSEKYEKITSTGFKKYAFLGTTVRIEVYSETHISVQYNYENREYKEAFVRLSRPVDEILSSAQEARDEMLFDLIDNGPVYTSQGYGQLEFKEGGRFNWIMKDALITRRVVSSAAGNSGRISFNLFPDKSIKAKYDGGFYLIFSNGETLSFLYSKKDDGLQILHIPSRHVDENGVVLTDNFYDPINMFFTVTLWEDESEGPEGEALF